MGEHGFITNARFVLTGDSRAKGPLRLLHHQMSDERIEATLTSLAESGNSDLPVAARLQQRPGNVADLVRDPESITVQASRRGVVYKLPERPRQSRRPRPLSLATDQKRAVQLEVDRLQHKCHAIERVEEHDGHKAILRAKAEQYER